MRVTFILPHAGMAGGIRVLAVYADRLRRRGHDVTVVSQPLAKRGMARRWKDLVLRRPRANVEPEPSFFENVDVPHYVLKSARPVLDGDVPDGDVVLATFWRTAPWVAALSPQKGAKAIFLQGYETS